MEEGSLRCDANVSVRPSGSEAFGTQAEIKNLNSFRFVPQAIEYEIARQVRRRRRRAARRAGDAPVRSPTPAETVSMRSKEEAHDYRYFPEPDLPPLVVARGRSTRSARRCPSCPRRGARRFVAQYGFRPTMPVS